MPRAIAFGFNLIPIESGRNVNSWHLVGPIYSCFVISAINTQSDMSRNACSFYVLSLNLSSAYSILSLFACLDPRYIHRRCHLLGWPCGALRPLVVWRPASAGGAAPVSAVSPPPSHCTTAPLYHCTTAPLYHYPTVPPPHGTTAPLYHCPTVPPPHCTTAPPYHRPTAAEGRVTVSPAAPPR